MSSGSDLVGAGLRGSKCQLVLHIINANRASFCGQLIFPIPSEGCLPASLPKASRTPYIS